MLYIILSILLVINLVWSCCFGVVLYKTKKEIDKIQDKSVEYLGEALEQSKAAIQVHNTCIEYINQEQDFIEKSLNYVKAAELANEEIRKYIKLLTK